jgi:hypothetical protein
MVLYFCLIPNRGARIGHQTHDHFNCLAFCNKNNFIFVYHPFTANSSNFENILQFKTLYEHNYENTVNNVDKIINISCLINDSIISKNTNLKKLIELNESLDKFLLFDNICGNENYSNILNFNINNNDIIEVKKKYRGTLLPYYKNIVLTEYICIHVRCGDIINDKSRYLSVNYFIEKYNYLIQSLPDIKKLPVYIITENNFKDDHILYENIFNCNIIKTDEITSFYYLAHCKYLIASRSGFSNLAYILGEMKVIKPPNDWNCYWDNLIK